MKHSVLLDTSFFIRLLNDQEKLHQNALGYYKHFLDSGFVCQISTISVAEYCVKGDILDLPLRNLQILPFNLQHATRAGAFAEVIFRQKGITGAELSPRAIIPNDAKLFAQADVVDSTTYFVTSDARSQGTYSLLRKEINPKFTVLDISIPYNETFGLLGL